ncbi:P-loop containing nucleoside triphosphate hydrolase protein [Favolaschia claudopus]|uniref:P-loop containing nucleoside triphosphate hydrolase protein n=1 Tax=Favolaschia claudopus TaxID=2862362 RepID=A0AAW0D0B7_9AGAR
MKSAAGSTTQLSESQYALRCKELLTLMSQLRAVGAQTDLDLPRITVIGNQSAGKSSLVEAISGIKCRLSSSTNQWSCRISIRVEFEENGAPRGDVTEMQFGDTITKKAAVETALRRAQFAVLHPSLSFQDVLSYEMTTIKEGLPGLQPLPFSRNVVCVDLEGPELTDLMFLDLPGLIANADTEIINLVEEMVVSYIKGNSLILVALPMTDDIENQKALRLARQVDPHGARTIGVLTKPDMLTEGSNMRELWLDVIEGRSKHQLLHGYFCTRQPDDAERRKNITVREARSAENEFFSQTLPWSGTAQKHRFGTENLVSTLSTLLVSIINDSLPRIQSMANDHIATCLRELEGLPPKAVGDPATHMLNLITSFCTDIRQYVDGQSDMSILIHERNAAFTEFKEAINKTQPKFVAQLPGQAGTHGFPIQIDNEGGKPPSATDLIASQKPVYLTDVQAHIAQSITRELPGNIPFSAKKTLIAAFQSTWLACAVKCFDSVKESMFSLLMRCINDQFGRYSRLQNKLQMCITTSAQKHFLSCAETLMAILNAEQMPYTQNTHYLQASTEKWLGRYKDERAGNKRNNTEEEPAGKRRKLNTDPQPSASTSREDMFKFGPAPGLSTPATAFGASTAAFGTPMTAFGAASSSSSAFKMAKNVPGPAFGNQAANPAQGFHAYATKQQTPRPVERTPSPSPTPVISDAEKINNVLAQLADLGYTGITADDFGKLRQADQFETEIAVMSEVRGYFQRVIDIIPQLIDSLFLRTLAASLQGELISEFGLGGENATAVCAALLEEDPALVAKREELLARSRRLEKVQGQLREFGLNRPVSNA